MSEIAERARADQAERELDANREARAHYQGLWLARGVEIEKLREDKATLLKVLRRLINSDQEPDLGYSAVHAARAAIAEASEGES